MHFGLRVVCELGCRQLSFTLLASFIEDASFNAEAMPAFGEATLASAGVLDPLFLVEGPNVPHFI